MNIVLCGLPASGKTSIGKLLAHNLKRSFIDIDQFIIYEYTKEYGKVMSCKEIFLEHGESFFRELEKTQIVALTGHNERVIALGGGSLCYKDNIAVIKKLGFLIYLQTPKEILWERIQKRGMLAYLDNDPQCSFYQVATSREQVFEREADLIIEVCQRTEESVCEEIKNFVDKMFSQDRIAKFN